MAQHRNRPGTPAAQEALQATMAGVVDRIRAHLSASIGEARQRRELNRQMAGLDDGMLSDIGLHRSQLAALAVAAE